MFYFQLTHKTGFDGVGLYYLRPLFFPDDDLRMKFNLKASNFKIHYETFYNTECVSGSNQYDQMLLDDDVEDPQRKFII